jgi:DGQHR domain-containing protein
MSDLNLQQSFLEEEPSYSEAASFTAVLLSQGKHRFYTIAMPSGILARCCIVEPRARNPREGFQRLLDEKRAQDIADYIDSFGTIPSSIILSAQPEAELQYVRKTRTVKFNVTPRSFLIIDGQHRVYGFSLAKSVMRVPVVIYSGLTRPEECRIFIDVNTKQRPVPNELLLDIKRLAETETDSEALMKDAFDYFNQDGASPLLGLMSPTERRQGRISRVTFNAALKQVLPTFADNDADTVYQILSAYLHACISGLRTHAQTTR